MSDTTPQMGPTEEALHLEIYRGELARVLKELSDLRTDYQAELDRSLQKASRMKELEREVAKVREENADLKDPRTHHFKWAVYCNCSPGDGGAALASCVTPRFSELVPEPVECFQGVGRYLAEHMDDSCEVSVQWVEEKR